MNARATTILFAQDHVSSHRSLSISGSTVAMISLQNGSSVEQQYSLILVISSERASVNGLYV